MGRHASRAVRQPGRWAVFPENRRTFNTQSPLFQWGFNFGEKERNEL